LCGKTVVTRKPGKAVPSGPLQDVSRQHCAACVARQSADSNPRYAAWIFIATIERLLEDKLYRTLILKHDTGDAEKFWGPYPNYGGKERSVLDSTEIEFLRMYIEAKV